MLISLANTRLRMLQNLHDQNLHESTVLFVF